MPVVPNQAQMDAPNPDLERNIGKREANPEPTPAMVVVETNQVPVKQQINLPNPAVAAAVNLQSSFSPQLQPSDDAAVKDLDDGGRRN